MEVDSKVRVILLLVLPVDRNCPKPSVKLKGRKWRPVSWFSMLPCNSYNA